MLIKNLSNSELETSLRAKALEERKLSLEIIELLEEMDRRKLYLERGYGSLIEYCVKELKYSEGAAYRRISCMRIVREVPETKIAIQEGSLNLVTVAKAQTFFRAEAKANHTYTKEEKIDLLGQLKNQSVRSAEKLFLELSPGAVPQEKVRQVSDHKTQVTLVVSAELMQKLEKLKNLLSHTPKAGHGEYADLIDHLADLALKKLDPNKRRETAEFNNNHSERAQQQPSAQIKPQEQSISRNAQPAVKLKVQPKNHRYIPAAVKREVWQKAKGQCCYQNPQTRIRCTSKKYLEIDHIMPIAKGGTNKSENLQLLCDAHNRWKGTREFANCVQGDLVT
jgi:5-methylcytosine-specific restriction endonuclease McrA